MMGIKSQTKAFGETQTAPKTEVGKSQGLTPEDLQKLGGENMGEVLNKMSDPNYVDPSKKTRAVGNDKLDKDAFFKLMIANMKNQDPTNPMKSHEMAAQLANFSSLEQMQNLNTTLTEMKNGQKPMEQFQALNFIGKAVAGDSAKVIRAKGDKTHDLSFNLPAPAKQFSVHVKNAEGEVIKKLEMKGLKGGDNSITWNGEDDRGNKAPAGEYQFLIEAVGSNDQKLAVKTDFSGVITGVNYTPEGPVLMVGNQSVRLKDVRKIVDPSLMNNGQKKETVPSQDLKMISAMNQTGNVQQEKEDSGAPEAAPRGKSMMEAVGLSSEMMDKIARETAPDQGVGSGNGG